MFAFNAFHQVDGVALFVGFLSAGTGVQFTVGVHALKHVAEELLESYYWVAILFVYLSLWFA